MRWAVFGLVLLAIVAALVIGTDAGAWAIRRGIFYRSPPSPSFRLTPPGRVIPLMPPPTQRPLVISKYTIGNDYCVRYEIRGTFQSACHGSAGRATCYDVARVGDQLPEGCR